MRVLQITVHLFPNVGGVETHLNDLFNSLTRRGWQVYVLAYQPLSTRTEWKILEKEKQLTIIRIPWIRGFFERLVHHPVFEFIYLVPGLFFVTPFIVFIFKPDVLHAHGLSAAVVAVFWGKLFGIRTVISLHSIYSFPEKGLYHNFVKFIFENCDFILSLSKKSNKEIEQMRISKGKLGVFTYWIDLQNFKHIPDARRKIGWEEKFTVLFVGRLIEEKGVKELLTAASMWDHNINLIIVGSGLLEEYILKRKKNMQNVFYLGKVHQNNLPLYYSAADCVIVPSISEEGFGRVIIESLACKTPVIASKKGATVEAMDESVGKFIEVNPENIKKSVEYFSKNPNMVKRLAVSSRKFVERRYSESNVQTIIKAYAS